MKSMGRLIALLCVIVPSMVFAQAVETGRPQNDAGDPREPLLRETERDGWTTGSLQSLVQSSDIIVRAKYGRLVGQERFYGYRESREEIAERLKITDQSLLDKLGLPQSEYEIHVEEVLKEDGVLKGSQRVVLRVLEGFDAPKRESLVNYREGEHLLFLRATQTTRPMVCVAACLT